MLIAIAPTTACAPVAMDQPDVAAWSNLDLWDCSFQEIHSHPSGAAGTSLELADQDLLERRSRIRRWLAEIEGDDTLTESDDQTLYAATQVVWAGAIDEGAIHRRVDRCLDELERRAALSEG